MSSRLERMNKLDRDYSYYIIIIKSLHKVTHFYRKLTITLFDPNKKKKHVKLVQKNAMGVWNEGGSFREAVEHDEEVSNLLTRGEIENCFDLQNTLRNVDFILKRAGINN